jgi:hypothetical protein|tara:strand:- start:38 stop:166 length:129 start_codon:yes stop_codon:yes gene_type:complete
MKQDYDLHQEVEEEVKKKPAKKEKEVKQNAADLNKNTTRVDR